MRIIKEILSWIVMLLVAILISSYINYSCYAVFYKDDSIEKYKQYMINKYNYHFN